MNAEEFCPNCEDYRETKVIEKDENYTVRGQDIVVPVTVKCCCTCGEQINSDEDDQKVLNSVYAEYRKRNDLLTPERIKNIRKEYQLSQKSFASLLGMSEATINRYEQGGLQEQTYDQLIRTYETPDSMRDLLKRRGEVLSDWQLKRVIQTLEGEVTPDSGNIMELGKENWFSTTQELSELTGYRLFEYKRFAAAILWFCKKWNGVFLTKLNKLIFYTDFQNYRTTTVSLTGTSYRRVPFGPVPCVYEAPLSRMEFENLLINSSPDEEKKFYEPGPNAHLIDIEFTPEEFKILEQVATELGGLTATQISRRSHEEAAWKDTEDRQLISYRKAQDLSLSLPE